MFTSSKQWSDALFSVANPEKAIVLAGFFKTEKEGMYGYGDKFLGITVPINRSIARRALQLPFSEYIPLISSEFHELRLSALLALVLRYKKADSALRADIIAFYLSQTRYINNWDLVDLSTPYIIGTHVLESGDYSIPLRLVESDDMWEKRIGIVSMLTPVRRGICEEPMRILSMNLHHSHDLIQKANGWLLREVYKKHPEVITAFLDENAVNLPRTTLRYTIEKMPKTLRKHYLHLK